GGTGEPNPSNLADPDNLPEAIGVMTERLKAQGERLNALINNAAISPNAEDGRRLGSIETDFPTR
ncbi:MAG TPA: hypothetical protein VED02_01825, partial [Methyloceanibacter sp.]|nr:hypothetical protein [Methyloceanibacter sp.]